MLASQSDTAQNRASSRAGRPARAQTLARVRLTLCAGALASAPMRARLSDRRDGQA